MQTYFTGAALKAMAKQSKYKDIIIRFNGANQSIEFIDAYDIILSASIDCGYRIAEGATVLLNANLCGTMRFFFESLKPTDKISFNADKNCWATNNEKGIFHYDLIANIKRYKSDNVTLKNVFEVILSKQQYSEQYKPIIF